MAQQIMEDKFLRVMMDTSGNSGRFVTAVKDIGDGFTEINKQIQEIEDAFKQIKKIWEGDARDEFIVKMAEYIAEVKEYCGTSNGTMVKLYKNGIVKAQKAYANAEQKAVSKIESVPKLK